MRPEVAKRALSIFEEALDRPAESRSAFLEEAYGSDAALRAEVESLLAHDGADWAAMDEPALGPDFDVARLADLMAAADRPLPDRVGRYRIIEEIGRGAMGVVYRAEQDHPRREVALKLIRPAAVSKSMLKRFEREAVSLARLRHPGIAQIHDAGTAPLPGGTQPYIAMELIDGPSLIEYARQKGLDTRQRLELLARVCEAVEYAHQRGVIHRDLKPENILVEDGPEGPRPRILDFGTARLIAPDAPPATLATEPGTLVGTLAYMSPEQVEGEVDTRTDVYAVGVIGYELLTGRLPIEVRDSSIVTAILRIRNDAPQRAGRHDSLLRGDLEAVLSKALEKDRDRRYATASDLRRDIERFLGHEPVQARRPTTLYVLGKLARRRKKLVAVVCAMLATLIGALGVSSYYLVQATRARNDLSDVASFLVLDVIQRLDEIAGTTEVRRDLLAQLEQRVRGLLRHDPADRRLRGAYGDILRYRGNMERDAGRPEAAIGYRERALTIRKELLVQVPDDVAQRLAYAKDLILLGDCHVAFDEHGDNDPARQRARLLYEEAMAIHEALLAEDPESPTYLNQVAWGCNRLAAVATRQNRLRDAETLLGRQIELAQDLLGRDPESLDAIAGLRAAYVNLAEVSGSQQRVTEAQEHSRRSFDYARQLVVRQPDRWVYLEMYACSAHGLASTALALEHVELAAEYHAIAESALDRLLRLRPDSLTTRRLHVDMRLTAAGLATVQRRFEDAVGALTRAGDLAQALYEQDPGPKNLHYLAGCGEAAGRLAIAAGWAALTDDWCALVEDYAGDRLANLELTETASTSTHLDGLVQEILDSDMRLVATARALAWPAEGHSPRFEEAACLMRRAIGLPAGDTGLNWFWLALIYRDAGDRTRAEECLLEAVSRLRPDEGAFLRWLEAVLLPMRTAMEPQPTP